jgi:4-amino-4-deoxy-L-arabinose transferase-like glycosyltransferase
MNPLSNEPHIKALKYWILGSLVLISLLYASTAPILEKNDEDHHLAMAIHYATGGGMPVQQPGQQTPWMQEGSQPPLYYWLASVPTRLFDTSNFEAQMLPNASPQYSPNFPGNKNKLLLTPEKFAFSYEGATLAAFVLRVLGILTGVATAWFTFKLAERVTGRPYVALLAMGLAAFNPMLLAVTTAVSNDGLVIALCAAALWMLAECLMDRISLRRAVALGGVLGLASLTKTSGTLLLPIVCLALVIHTATSEKRTLLDWRTYRFAFVAGLAWLALAGWWFARNFLLYGEFTGTAMMVRVAGARDFPLDFIGEFRAFRMTYLGIFGQTNVPMPALVYSLWDWFLLSAAAGVVIAWIVHRQQLTTPQRIMLAAMAGFIAIVCIFAVLWTRMTVASHGRLLFPALPAAVTFLAIGIAQLLSLARLPRRAAPWGALPFAVVAAITPLVAIAPAYQPPFINGLPAQAIPAQMGMAPFAEVIGYRMTPDTARPGDTVRVAVYLRALQPTTSDYLLSTQLYGRDNTPLARFDTFTGGGLLPSSTWQPGQMWVDEMDMRIPEDAATPALLRLQFSLFSTYHGDFATNIDATGKAGSPLFDGTTLLPPIQPLQPGVVTFGNTVALRRIEGEGSALRAGKPYTLTLNWLPLAPAQQDATIFVHLIDAQGRLVAQSDSPPDAGQFPSTRWQQGAAFAETRVLNVPADAPAGGYRLSIGLYDPQTGERWPAKDIDGEALQDASFTTDAIPLTR